MSQDILIKSDDLGVYDIQIDGADFESTGGLETAVSVSYFTDARAPAVQVQSAQNRRGWVGNILNVDIDRELGGLLWILDQARITEDTLNFAKSFAQDSLQWLLDDGLARSITITVERTGAREITISTVITTIDNTVLRYVTLWRSTDFNRTVAS